MFGAKSFWAAAAAITLLLYWLCLRFLFPGYFAPGSPYHMDFYLYAGASQKTFAEILSRYPRPASYIMMKLLAPAGLSGLMAGSVAIALGNFLLTLALVRRVFRVYSPWLLVSFALYTLLLMAQPDFYWEHRHDLPAQVSYLFLMVALIAWDAWLERPRKFLLISAVVCAILFAFAKETYFVTALCLLLGFAIADRANRLRHFAFASVVLVLEVASLLWTSHLNSPFVNANAAAGSSYHISLAPGSVASTYLFYLSHLMNPALMILAILSLTAAWSKRRTFVLAAAFIAAGLTVFATHATLPNHLFEEYSWAAAPLLFAPALLLYRPWIPPLALFALVAAAIAGPGGYLGRYSSEDLQWMVRQDQRGGRIANSLASFHAIPPPARILVAGHDDPALPWQMVEFIRAEFGDRLYWTVLLPPGTEPRRASRLVRFAEPSEVHLSDFDYLATYAADGTLVRIAKLSGTPAVEDIDAVLVPALGPPLAVALARPNDYGAALNCAAVAIQWGLWDGAAQFLKSAKSAGAGNDPTFRRLSADLEKRPPAASSSTSATLRTDPARIVLTDGSETGITDVIWTVPPGTFVEVHINAPNGPLFSAAERSGHSLTQNWVRDGTEFFLQDVTGGKPLTAANTLAHVKVEVTR